MVKKPCLLAIFVSLLTLNTYARETIPPYLFHWTNSAGLKRLAQSIRNGRLQFNHIPEEVEGMGTDISAVQETLPFISSGRVLYTWSHPIGGLGLSTNEIYAGDRTGRESDTTPRLLILRIKQSSRVITIKSSDWELGDFLRYDQNGSVIREPTQDGSLGPYKYFIPSAIDPKNVDIYKFENWLKAESGNDFLYFTEWIILNPDAVESFTADPGIVRETLKLAIQEKLDTQTDIYGGTHNTLFSTPEGLTKVYNVIGNTRRSCHRGLPQNLKLPLLESLFSCNQLF